MNILITGGNKGIGLELTKFLLKKGHNIYIFARDFNNKAFQQLLNYNSIFAYNVDVQDHLNVCKHILMIPKIDILINNAAINIDGTVHKLNGQDWDKIINVNLTGTFNCCRGILPLMRKQNFGRIINIISVLALTGAFGAGAYSASKAGIIGLTKSIALENATKNITANCIAYGYMGIGMCERLSKNIKQSVLQNIPMHRFGELKEIIYPVLFLMSKEAGYIKGQVLNVNGGLF